MTRWIIGFWLALFCALALARAQQSPGPVDIPVNLSMIDLSGYATPVAAQRQNLAIEIPGETAGGRAVLELRARGPGPTYNWTVFTIHNAAPIDRKLVLVIDEQRFAGSGVIDLKPFGARPLGVAFSSGQDTLERQPVQGGDAVAFTLKGASTVTFAVEGAQTIRAVRLYAQAPFASREASLAFLRGAVLAIAALLAFGSIALYGIRAHTAFIAGGFFAFTAMGFMALESGYLGGMSARLMARGFTPDTVRAAAESLFLLGLAVAFSAFNALRQRGLWTVLAVVLLLLACLANLAFAYIEPRLATMITRIAFVVLTVLAFVVSFLLRRSAAGVLRQGLLFWGSLSIWVFYAAVAANAEKPDLGHHAGLLAGLAAVLAVMAFTLVRFAFAQGFLAKPFLTDANRRSLALSGAQHVVWDWQPFEERLEIGADLARILGFDEAAWRLKPRETFFAILHPEDEPSLQALMDDRQLRPNAFHEVELRLRDAEGNYRWFALRVRALPGGNNRAARAIGTLTEITRNKIVENRLISDAVHDPVTGLPSRAIFADRLAREIEKPLALPVRVLFIGLERFKTLNEGLGHDIGDQLLLVAGQRISENLAPGETVARLTGSQFAVMFVEAIDSRGAEALAEKIRRSLAEPVALGDRDVYLSAAIGISLSSLDGYGAEALQDQAATALHEAQKLGRQTVRVYEPTDEDQREAHLALETELRQAIDRREIEVLYQPIVSLETRAIVGLEALARWRHPEQGLLPPSKFLGLAEQAGLLHEISLLVLQEAARQMGIWQRTVIRARPVYCAVNVSADLLIDQGFVERLRSIVNREGLRPNAMKIEITESVAMRHPDRARAFVQKLQALGIGVACDDFGTGFSSLASLRDLPFDTLKIDRTFLLPEALAGRGGVILDTVVALAHNLGMLVVAEGIESEAQAERLSAVGCDLGQGFHLGEPMSARNMQDLLAVFPHLAKPLPLPGEAPPLAPVQPGLAPLAPRRPRKREDDIFEETPPDARVTPAPAFDPPAPVPPPVQIFEPPPPPKVLPLDPPASPPPNTLSVQVVLNQLPAQTSFMQLPPQQQVQALPPAAPPPIVPDPPESEEPVPEELPSIFGVPGQFAAELRAVAKPPPVKKKRRRRRGRVAYKDNGPQ